jgi:hypothetical protein
MDGAAGTLDFKQISRNGPLLCEVSRPAKGRLERLLPFNSKTLFLFELYHNPTPEASAKAVTKRNCGRRAGG